jgi:hypothetical protein
MFPGARSPGGTVNDIVETAWAVPAASAMNNVKIASPDPIRLNIDISFTSALPAL